MIKIVDNFFENKLFLSIKKHITTNIYYTPKYFDNTKEKSDANYYGSRFILAEDEKLLNTFKTTAESKFNIKIKQINENSGIDIRNLNNFKPHKDNKNAKINILIMLVGPTAVTNGTVFYSDDKLDIHVGFKENRSVLFPSTLTHSPHASNIPNLRRFTSTLFVKDYEE
tara:strand:- start:24 stop:530 length:507 start_codon:yes stop_codon:yes gene_type:complete